MDSLHTDRNTLGRNLAGYMLKLAHKFKINLKKALATGDVEAVHDLRVASRRMSEPLLVLEENLPDGNARAIRKGLRRFRSEFRTLRDLDVLIEVLNDTPDTDSTASENLVDEVRAKREKELLRVVRKCEKIPLNRLLRRIRRVCHELQSDHFDQRATCILSELFDQRAEEIRTASSRENDGDLHPTRIAVKKMKYCVELIEKLHIREERELIDELSGLQSILGHWNDKINGARWLARFAGRRKNLVSKKVLCAAAVRMSEALLSESDSDRKAIAQRLPALTDKLDHLSAPGNGFRRHVSSPAEMTVQSA